MKIGLLAFVTAQSVDPASLAKKCESLGFESFYLPEHAIIPVKHKTRYPLSKDGEIPEPYSQMVDPFVGLALAAAATKRSAWAPGFAWFQNVIRLFSPKKSPLSIITRADALFLASAPDGCVTKARSWVSISSGDGRSRASISAR